jgi:hypothetical protein
MSALLQWGVCYIRRMKKLVPVLVGVFLLATGAAQPLVPVTSLHLDATVTLPNDSQRILGDLCVTAVSSFSDGSEWLASRDGEGCYTVSTRYRAAGSVLSWIGRRAVSAGYVLAYEDTFDMAGVVHLAQLHVHPEKNNLYFVYWFEETMVMFIVVRVPHTG